MFQNLQKKMKNENMIEKVRMTPIILNYVIKNNLLFQIYPLLNYYLINKNFKPVLPRVCEDYVSEQTNNCQMEFNKFLLKRTFVFQKKSISILYSASYKCNLHNKSKKNNDIVYMYNFILYKKNFLNIN